MNHLAPILRTLSLLALLAWSLASSIAKADADAPSTDWDPGAVRVGAGFGIELAEEGSLSFRIHEALDARLYNGRDLDLYVGILAGQTPSSFASLFGPAKWTEGAWNFDLSARFILAWTFARSTKIAWALETFAGLGFDLIVIRELRDDFSVQIPLGLDLRATFLDGQISVFLRLLELRFHPDHSLPNSLFRGSFCLGASFLF